MFALVYRSTASVNFKSIDLAELVMVCRNKNRTLGVTGMLAYEDGRFLQALEGAEYMVREVMAVIQRDPRHNTIEILGEETIKHRRFPDWAMGYGRLDDEEAGFLAQFRDATPPGTLLGGAAPSTPDPEKSLRTWRRRPR